MATPGRELSSIDFESMLGGPLMAVINAQAKAAMSSVNFIKAVGFAPGTSTDPLKPSTSTPINVAFEYEKVLDPGAPAIKGTIGITVGTAGAGYVTPPAVTIGPPPAGGSQATAIARIDTGTVTSIDMIDAGSGYTSAPTVTIAKAPTGGTDATATATPKDIPATPASMQRMKLEVPILTMLPIPFIRIEETTIDFNAKINSIEETKTDTTSTTSGSGSGSVSYPPMLALASVKLKVSTSNQKNTQSGSKVDRTYSMAVHIRAVQDEMPAGMERILGILEDAIVAKPA